MGFVAGYRRHTEDGTNGFGHRSFPLLFHQRASVGFLFCIFVEAGVDVVPAPAAVAVVTAVVGIPAEDVPDFLPGEPVIAGKGRSGELPRGWVPCRF